MGVAPAVAAGVGVWAHPAALGGVVLAELGLVGVGFVVVIQRGEMVRVVVASCGGEGVAEGQRGVTAEDGAVVGGPQAFGAEPVLVLEVGLAAGDVKGDGLRSPVILAGILVAGVAVPGGDALAAVRSDRN